MPDMVSAIMRAGQMLSTSADWPFEPIVVTEEEEEKPPPWTGPYPGVGDGAGVAAGVGGGADFPPSAYYSGIFGIADPLADSDRLDFVSRMTQPGQYYPSTFYSLINKSMMPMGMNMPGEFYGMMEGAMPSGIAPGTPTPDFSFLGGLGQAPMPEVGAYLLQALESRPELALALMDAVTTQAQQQQLPFLPLVTGRGEAGETGLNDFLALLFGGGV